MVTWSSFGRHEVILPWMQIAGPRDAAVAATILELDHARQRISRHGTQTDVAFAIEVGMDQLDTLPWEASKSVINVVADGISNLGRVAMADRNLALARGFTVNGLIMARGSAIEVISRYFRREVIGGPTSFQQLSASNEDFARAMLPFTEAWPVETLERVGSWTIGSASDGQELAKPPRSAWWFFAS